MNDLSLFFEDRQLPTPNRRFPVSKNFKYPTGHPKEGQPVEWEFKVISVAEVDELEEKSRVKGEMDLGLFAKNLIAACVVYPDLHNAELQDRYGVKGDIPLLEKLIKLPGDFQAAFRFLRKIHGYEDNINELIEKAKNS